MIRPRDLSFLVLGAAGATIGFALAGGPSVAAGFLLGAAVSALLAWRAIRTLSIEREAAELAARDLGLRLLGAWNEADQLRRRLGQEPAERPNISDLTREGSCSSTAS